MDTLGYAAGSALLTHQIVEQLKARFSISNGLLVLGLSFVINFVLAVGWAFYDHQSVSVAFVRGVAQAVASAVYHDTIGK